MARPWSPRAILVGIVLVGAALRLDGIHRAELWYDELQSLTHAIQPVRALIDSVWRMDAHPPAYYLQLHFWMTLGTGESWLALNAALFSILTIPSLYFVASRLEDERTALWASAFLAVWPLALVYSQEVRMYAWVMLLAIWALYFNDRLLRTLRPVRDALAYGVIALCFLYSHGAAFLLLASIGVASALIIGNGSATRLGLRGWIGVHVVLAVAYLPWAYRAMNLGLGHVRPMSGERVGEVLARLMLGDTTPTSGWMLLAAAAALGVTVLVAVRTPTRRVWGTLAIASAPFAAAVVLSTTGRPIFHERAIAFSVPFVALACGVIASELGRRELRLPNALAMAARASAVGLVGVLLLAAAVEVTSLPRSSQLTTLARELEARSREPRTLYVEHAKDAWALCWLLVGPGSVPPRREPGTGCRENGTVIQYTMGRPASLPSDREVWRIWRTELPPEQVAIAERSVSQVARSYAAEQVRAQASPTR